MRLFPGTTARLPLGTNLKHFRIVQLPKRKEHFSIFPNVAKFSFGFASIFSNISHQLSVSLLVQYYAIILFNMRRLQVKYSAGFCKIFCQPPVLYCEAPSFITVLLLSNFLTSSLLIFHRLFFNILLSTRPIFCHHPIQYLRCLRCSRLFTKMKDFEYINAAILYY